MDKFIENLDNDIKERVFDIFQGTMKFSLLALALSKKIILERDEGIVFLNENVIEITDRISSGLIANCFKEMEFVAERIVSEINESKKSSLH